jgi:hypothetical protein
VIEWNARRLAALDRELDAIIRTDARDRKVAAWLEDTAEAFEEIEDRLGPQLGEMPIVCPIRGQRRSITMTCTAGGKASGRQCPPCRGRGFPNAAGGFDVTRLDTTMLVFAGSREHT